MKKQKLAIFFGLFILGASFLVSCKKENNLNLEPVEQKGIFTKEFPEISLKMEYRSSKFSSDSAAVTLYGNYSLRYLDSKYNEEQQLEYFLFICDDDMKVPYLVSGIINNAAELTINYQKLNKQN